MEGKLSCSTLRAQRDPQINLIILLFTLFFLSILTFLIHHLVKHLLIVNVGNIREETFGLNGNP
jgi:hypothetical protein